MKDQAEWTRFEEVIEKKMKGLRGNYVTLFRDVRRHLEGLVKEGRLERQIIDGYPIYRVTEHGNKTLKNEYYRKFVEYLEEIN